MLAPLGKHKMALSKAICFKLQSFFATISQSSPIIRHQCTQCYFPSCSTYAGRACAYVHRVGSGL